MSKPVPPGHGHSSSSNGFAATSLVSPETETETEVTTLYPKVRAPKPTPGVEFAGPRIEDGPAINALFNKVFHCDRSLSHYEWKYWRNPAGPPVGTLAREIPTGRCLATGIGQRRRASVDGRDSCGALLCEVASDPESRGGGRLWREVMMGFSTIVNDQDGLHWAFGGQSTDEAIKVGKRWFGYRVILKLVPWELRLGTRSSLRRRLGKSWSWLMPAVAPILDAILWRLWRKRDFGLSATEVEKFSSEYDELWERYRHLYPVCFFRDSETLNWRYVANPLWKHRIVEARREGQLVGYLVWREADQGGERIATVLDFWHGDNQQVMQTLLDVARRKACLSHCVFLRFALQEGGAEHKAFQSFRSSRKSPYEEVDKIICTPIPGSNPMEQKPEVYELLRTVLFGKNWFYTQGDCDYRD
jgi:hypothetical protein